MGTERGEDAQATAQACSSGEHGGGARCGGISRSVSAVAGRRSGEQRPDGRDQSGARGRRRGVRRTPTSSAARSSPGRPNVPWAVFRAHTTTAVTTRTRSSRARSQMAPGRRGAAARSAASPVRSPTFTGSLNFDQAQDGEAPAIDFAGAGRTVPWATWYEDTTALRRTRSNIFASRFDTRTNGQVDLRRPGSWARRPGTVPVPSLNIHTNQDAENPSVAGGSTADRDQARAVGHLAGDRRRTRPGPPARTRSSTVKPTGPGDARTATASSRSESTTAPVMFRPSVASAGTRSGSSASARIRRMNVDPHPRRDRAGHRVHGYRATRCRGSSGTRRTPAATADCNNNEMVFAAKARRPRAATPPTGTVDGGFNWVAVGGDTGSGRAGQLGSRRHAAARARPTRRPAR